MPKRASTRSRRFSARARRVDARSGCRSPRPVRRTAPRTDALRRSPCLRADDLSGTGRVSKRRIEHAGDATSGDPFHRHGDGPRHRDRHVGRLDRAVRPGGGVGRHRGLAGRDRHRRVWRRSPPGRLRWGWAAIWRRGRTAEHYAAERERELRETEEMPQQERAEVAKLFRDLRAHGRGGATAGRGDSPPTAVAGWTS